MALGAEWSHRGQLLAKMIPILPGPAKLDGLEYMGKTELAPHTRAIATLLNDLDERYGETDTEKAWSWITAFTDFSESSTDPYKEFWSRFSLCTTRHGALQMKLSDHAICVKALQALRLPGSRFPIVLSALDAKQNTTNVLDLGDIAIRMYETHRVHADRSDVFAANAEGRWGR